MTFGRRKKIFDMLGAEFVVRRGPESALDSAKIAAGYIVVFMSLLVTRYAVFRW
jgi:hypothetical protein